MVLPGNRGCGPSHGSSRSLRAIRAAPRLGRAKPVRAGRGQPRQSAFPPLDNALLPGIDRQPVPEKVRFGIGVNPAQMKRLLAREVATAMGRTHSAIPCVARRTEGGRGHVVRLAVGEREKMYVAVQDALQISLGSADFIDEPRWTRVAAQVRVAEQDQQRPRRAVTRGTAGTWPLPDSAL